LLATGALFRGWLGLVPVSISVGVGIGIGFEFLHLMDIFWPRYRPRPRSGPRL